MDKIFDNISSLKSQLSCKFCSKSFLPSRFSPKPQIFCSNRCRYKYRDRNKQKHGGSWQHFREIIVNTLGKRCFKCSSIEDLHIHHKVPKFLGGEQHMRNLVLLCKKCHTKLHKTFLREEKDKNQVKFDF